MARRDQVLSLFGASPAQVLQRIREENQALMAEQRSPQAAVGFGIGSALMKAFGPEDPRVAEARRRQSIGQGVLSQYATKEQAQAQQQQADQMMDDFGFSPDLPLTPAQQSQLKMLNDSEMYDELSKRYASQGMLQEAELARTMSRQALTKSMDIQAKITDEAYKKQLISASESQQQRAEADAEYKAWTQQNTQNKYASMQELVKSPEQLKALGISDATIAQITTASNPAAWYSFIEEKMKAKATATAKDDPAEIKGAKEFYNLVEQIIKLEKEAGGKRTEESKRLRLRALAQGRRSGITDVAVYERMVKDSTEKAEAASIQSAETARTIAWMEANKAEMLSGLSESTRAAFASIFGSQSPRDLINKKYTEIFTKEVINNLPPGVASDKDVALVLQGVIPANASPDIMIRYMKGLQTLAQARQAYHSEFLAYMEDITKGQDAAGFDRYYRDKQRVGKIKQLVDYGIPETEAEGIVDSGDLKFAKRVEEEEIRLNPPKPSASPTIDALRSELDALRGNTGFQVTEQIMP